MWQVTFLIAVVVLISVFQLPSVTAGTCEETETAHVKLDLAKQSINNAKLLYPKCADEKNDSECSVKDRSLAHLNAALDLISEAKITCRSCPETILPRDRPLDCFDVKAKISNRSGVYPIWPRTGGLISNESMDVYCDMETDGGGWTVIQRRGNFTTRTDFYQDWNTYKTGFGDIKQEFWLGNDKLFTITNQRNYSVRFDLIDVQKEHRHSAYKVFSIGNEKSGYVLSIRNHSGNANGDLEAKYNGQKFSTKDRKNDGRGNGEDCAIMHHSAFWFNSGCGSINVNGIYKPGQIDVKNIWWHNWKKSYECLYSVEIKIRPTNI